MYWLESSFAQAQPVPFHLATCPVVHDCGRRKVVASESVTAQFTPPPARPVPAVIAVMSPPEKWARTWPLPHALSGASPSLIWVMVPPVVVRQPV